MYLIDSNVILELLLEQEKADECEQFLIKTSPANFYISEFSLYSIGIILSKHKKYKTFMEFIEDFFLVGGVRLLRLTIEDMRKIIEISQKFNLDFDDAYQYVLAKKYGLILVSFDKDFDLTDLVRKTPTELL